MIIKQFKTCITKRAPFQENIRSRMTDESEKKLISADVSTKAGLGGRGLMVKLNVILLMEEILHQLIGSFSHYLHGFVHPRWCRISSINSNVGVIK